MMVSVSLRQEALSQWAAVSTPASQQTLITTSLAMLILSYL